MDRDTNAVVVLGGGPGGYRAAFMAADLGLGVTLIDPRENPGGVCLYNGCIPTKALLHLAKIMKDAKAAGETGIKFGEPDIDIDMVRKWKDDVVKKLTGGLGSLVKARKIKYVRGYGRFRDSSTMEVTGEKGDISIIGFKNAIIATGATSIVLPDLRPDGRIIMNSTQALDLKKVPETMLIVGGGYIGLEMAEIYHSLGSRITLAELTSNLMPGMDDDLISAYKKANTDTFADIFFNTSVKGADIKKDHAEIIFKNAGKEFRGRFAGVLVAVGNKPNTDSIGLEKTSVRLDGRGYIIVDEQQRANGKNIYAIGDVTGPPLLAHKAEYEGKVAAETISGRKAANDARVIPAVVYTDPEIATCGLNEEQARKKQIDYKTIKFPWSASGKAVAMNLKTGFTKLLINKENDRVIGAGIIGSNAGDLIPELALAIEMGATADDISLTIHPHPTLSETIMEAAEMYYGHATDYFTGIRK